ncbi:hypothetical protein, partial [Prevotella pallens]|uniref:hypothetical protein n=1 Tax=Prevotella pallens TaxID=60133 RepID=UPI0023F302ED
SHTLVYRAFANKHWCAWTSHSVCSIICGHDESAPTVGVRGYTLGVRNNCSIHSVGVGTDSLRPCTPNCVNCTHVFRTILTGYGERMYNIYYFFSYCL